MAVPGLGYIESLCSELGSNIRRRLKPWINFRTWELSMIEIEGSVLLW